MSPLEDFVARFQQARASRPIFSCVETVQSALDDVDIVPGQWILCTDTKEYYNDISDGVRIKISDTIQLDTEAQKNSIIPISGKFYFVKSSGILYRYENNSFSPVGSKASAIVTNDGSTVEEKLNTISKIGRSIAYVTVDTDGQTQFTVPFPFDNYLSLGNFVEVVIGTVYVDERRYTISGNTITFDNSITLTAGRTITFKFWYNDYSGINYTPSTHISANDVYLSNGQSVESVITAILQAMDSASN